MSAAINHSSREGPRHRKSDSRKARYSLALSAWFTGRFGGYRRRYERSFAYLSSTQPLLAEQFRYQHRWVRSRRVMLRNGFRRSAAVAEIGCAIASELETETSAGSLLIEALVSGLAARLLQRHVSGSSTQSFPRHTVQRLDRRRLFRVLDYIEANLEGDLSIERMATIACLSRYHFARAFRQAVGQSPHRYVSAKRLLERAKALLIHGDRPSVDIALALSFSSQANFTRAAFSGLVHCPSIRRTLISSMRQQLSPHLHLQPRSPATNDKTKARDAEPSAGRFTMFDRLNETAAAVAGSATKWKSK